MVEIMNVVSLLIIRFSDIFRLFKDHEEGEGPQPVGPDESI